MTSFSRLPFVASLAVCIAFSIPRVADAAPPHVAPPVVETTADRATKLREQGNQAMLDMRYLDALGLYEQARSLAPEALGVVYSIARAEQLLGNYPKALTALEEFDKTAGPELKAKVGDLAQLFAQLRARVSTLTLTCKTAGARVLVRDKVLGTTPLAGPVRLAAGAATLDVELEGFFPQHRSIVLPGGGALTLEVDLPARSQTGLVSIQSAPSGATVFVDDRPVGTTSPRVELALSAGEHRIVVHKDGFNDARMPVVLAAGASRDLTLNLEKSIPLTSRWWFWAGAGVVVAGGVAVTAALLTERSADRGSLSPGVTSAPLRF